CIPVSLQLAIADAVDVRKRRERLRPVDRNLTQGCVVEDHIGRHVALARSLGTPSTQTVEKRGRDPARDLQPGGAAALAAATTSFGLDTQQEGRLAAQQRAGMFGQ
ncbi:hypothetical protein RZS08_63745, partial [Arthrospira platensis SPKY1]|nr:hypothetical protein [Arthrospira platensis SPKY1]